MDLELVTNEVFNKLMKKLKENEVETITTNDKKFLQCDGKNLEIPDCQAIMLKNSTGKIKANEYEFLVIGKLSIDDMVSVANGLSSNDKTSAIREFILNGKEVYVLEEGIDYRHYKDISNPIYFNMLKDYELKISRFGIRILSSLALESIFNSKDTMTKSKNDAIQNNIKTHQSENRQQDIIYSSENKVITHKMAENLIDQKELYFKNKTIITPSAQDVFKENGTTITFI